MRTTGTSTEASAAPARRWRTVDIVVASVIGVALGLVLWVWNTLDPTLSAPLDAVPPLKSIRGGVWLLPGLVGALAIRKPGAALYVEVLAAVVSALLGSAWGLTVVLSGIIQGLAPELVFAVRRYRHWDRVTAVGAGAAAGVAMGVFESFVWYPEFSAGAKLVYVGAGALSGAVIAGIGGWLLVRALARTGVLDAFASGREQRAR